MNKSFLAFILTIGLFVTGCNNDQVKDIKLDRQTIEQALLDSGIDTDNILITEEIRGENAFSIYEKDDGFGIIQFVNTIKGWQYRGASGFEQLASGNPKPVTFGASTWLLGENSSNGKNTYNTVFIGEIHDPEITKIILEVNHGKYSAKILPSHNRKLWYYLSGAENAESLTTKISGYSSEGKLRYENYLNLPE
ncbi:hypothetical protein [Mesobacillus sp.]|uniref:hypothetical protein n=1 Tax=Mesobacillus sp. TaxID=2675271 RepID=UPI0039EE5D6F